MTGRYFDPDVIHRKVILTETQHDMLCEIIRTQITRLVESDLHKNFTVTTPDGLPFLDYLNQLLNDVENCYDALAPDHDELLEGRG